MRYQSPFIHSSPLFINIQYYFCKPLFNRMSLIDFSSTFTTLEVCHLTPECWQYESSIHHRTTWKAALAHRQWRRGYNAGGGVNSRKLRYLPNEYIFFHFRHTLHVSFPVFISCLFCTDTGIKYQMV